MCIYEIIWKKLIRNLSLIFFLRFSKLIWNHLLLSYILGAKLYVLLIFIFPSADGVYYGVVMSGSPFVSSSVFQSVSSPYFQLHASTYWDAMLYITFFMYLNSNSSAITFRQFLSELCPFWNLEYYSSVHLSISPSVSFHTFLSYVIWHFAMNFEFAFIVLCTSGHVQA